jgi:hypothetical protein
MTLAFLISILIVYGITNIVVFGTIFDGVKASFSKFIQNLKNKNNARFEDLADWQKYRKNERVASIGVAYQNYQDLIAASDNPNDHVINNFEQSRDNLLSAIQSVKHSKLRSMIIWGLSKIDKLIQCMMCTGFWVGLLFTILTLVFNINLFGIPIIILPEGSTWGISLFLCACLFSGTCWIINSIVDFLVVKKEVIESNGDYS